MPRRKKRPREWDSEQALRKLFPKEAREKARREARKARKNGESKPSKDKRT
jgi:hypothetical protein